MTLRGIRVFFFGALGLLLIGLALPARAVNIRSVVLVIGQSNCGVPSTAGIQYPGWVPRSDIRVWNYFTTNQWETMQPGINTDGAGSSWGPEVSFALAYTAWSHKPLDIIKMCPGSVGMSQSLTPTWSAYAPASVFSLFYSVAVAGLNRINTELNLPVIEAIYITGADTDTRTLDAANMVEVETLGLCNGLRARLSSQQAKCVIARVPSGTVGQFTSIVQAKQVAVGTRAGNGWFSTDDLTLVNVGGGLHFDPTSVQIHGQRAASTLLNIK